MMLSLGAQVSWVIGGLGLCIAGSRLESKHGHARITLPKSSAGSVPDRRFIPRQGERVTRRWRLLPEVSFPSGKFVVSQAIGLGVLDAGGVSGQHTDGDLPRFRSPRGPAQPALPAAPERIPTIRQRPVPGRPGIQSWVLDSKLRVSIETGTLYSPFYFLTSVDGLTKLRTAPSRSQACSLQASGSASTAPNKSQTLHRYNPSKHWPRPTFRSVTNPSIVTLRKSQNPCKH